AFCQMRSRRNASEPRKPRQFRSLAALDKSGRLSGAAEPTESDAVKSFAPKKNRQAEAAGCESTLEDLAGLAQYTRPELRASATRNRELDDNERHKAILVPGRGGSCGPLDTLCEHPLSPLDTRSPRTTDARKRRGEGRRGRLARSNPRDGRPG